MNKSFKGALCAAALIVAAAGCNDFLKGGDLTVDPNNPVVGTSNQFFAGVQTNLWFIQTGPLARLTSIWFQQADGVDRQSSGISNGTGIVEGSFDGDFFSIYGSSGVLDLRKIQAQSIASGDSLYLGISKVLEAWMIGTAADFWGDVPYNQADSALIYPQPILDPQEQVYDSVQARLSTAIAEINAGVGVGPSAVDLVYSGDPAKWTALAHTLKARFFLHTAEKLGTIAYDSALAETALGISSNAGDYDATFNGQTQFTSNPWWQLADVNGGTGRFGYLTATASTFLYQLLNGDPRRALYYDLANSDQDGGFSATRFSPGFPQPLVTYNENLLIKAESQLETGSPGAALTTLNAERAAWGTAAPWHPAVTLAPSGSATLQAIINEKYIVLFQNMEVWNDYKRTCFPAITPKVTTDGGLIPGRILYPLGERSTNINVPAVGDQPERNWNDPADCGAS